MPGAPVGWTGSLMNERRNGKKSPGSDGVSAHPAAAVIHDPSAGGGSGLLFSQKTGSLLYSQKRNGSKTFAKRDSALLKDALFVIRRNDTYHIVSENYYYKTEPYYTILQHELEGKKVEPASSAVLDAYVIPICLSLAASAKIPVCEWGISQAYVPLPSILYGLNYFSTTLDYFIVNDNEKAKEVIRHITNNGKYPFCYQKFPEGSDIFTCTSVFGRTAGTGTPVSGYAQKIYEIFRLPLVKLVFVVTGDSYALSSLSPTRYAQLSDGERSLLSAYLSNQEFL
jgi:hypothetical protein